MLSAKVKMKNAKVQIKKSNVSFLSCHFDF